ncbi:MAG: S-layer homology domain-containing protein [Clostridia bacterium]|nr:S-layer homology domain-containing protein [Clostridia bacterium]
MKRLTSLLLVFFMLTQLCSVLSVFALTTVEKPLLKEDYTTNEAGSDYENREKLGWSVESTKWGTNKYASMSFDSGLKLHQTGNQQYVNSLFRKSFAVTESGNDDYMKVRRVNFKGIYDVELILAIKRDGNYRRNIIFNGGVNAAEKNIFNYGDAWGNGINQGFYKNFDSRWAGVTNNYTAGNATVTATYKTRLDFINERVHLFYNGSSTPSNYTGTDKIATSSGDAAPMTDGADYLSCVDFLFDYRNTSNPIIVKNMKLIEIERQSDATDVAVGMLSTAMLTSSPNEVTTSLNSLPDSESLGLSNMVDIEWSSSNPSVISNDGQTVVQQVTDTKVTMTAKLTNKEDGFTQYVDFNLAVPKIITDASRVYDLLDYSILTSEKPNELTMDLNLPSSLVGYDAQIEWSSSSDEIVIDSSAQKGIVVRPSGRKNKEVKLTATITDDYISTTKEFEFIVLTTFVLPEPKLIMYEVYKDLDMDKLDDLQIKNLGWSIDNAFKSDGTISHSNSIGIAITKKKAQNTAGSGDGFAAIKKLISTQKNYNGDSHMSVRQEAYKGIYNLELGLNLPYISSGYYRWIALYGKSNTGSSSLLTSYRIDYRFALNKTANFTFDDTTQNASKFGTFSLGTRINTMDDTFQAFHSSSSNPMTVTKNGETTDTFALASNSEVFDSLKFTIDERVANSNNNNRICVEYIKLTEIDRVEDITDIALKKLGTNLLTDTPDSVTSSLKPLPTAETLGMEDSVSIEWSSSDEDHISSDGQTVNRGQYNEEVVMTAKITSLADGFTQYADFNLTVKGTSSLSDVYAGLDYDDLTSEEPDAITSDLTLPVGSGEVVINWESNDPAIVVKADEGKALVRRPSGRASRDVVLKATVSDGIKILEKTFNFTVLTTYITPEPSVIKTWTFAGKTIEELKTEGLNILTSNADVYVNSDGNLVVKKLSDKNTSSKAERTQALYLPIRLYDEALSERENTYTQTHRGKYRIDYLLKVSDLAGSSDDLGLVFMNINGLKDRVVNSLAANFMLGYGKIQTSIPASPLYTSDVDYRFSPSPSPLNKFLDKWVRVRFEIDMFSNSNNQVDISYALGTSSSKPSENSQMIKLENPESGIPFATSSGKGLVTLETLSNPGIGFYEQLSKDTTIELSELKVTQIEKDPEVSLENLDDVLSQITIDNISDTPENYNTLKNTLPTSVVSNGRSYKVEWTSSNSSLVSDSGIFLGKDEDAGKDVYLTATVKYGSYSKSKEFKLTLGASGEDSYSAPSATNVSVSGNGVVGSVLTLSYVFNDETSTGDNSIIKWQSSVESEFYDIQGATGKTYKVRKEDAGKNIRAVVIPQNGLNMLGIAGYSSSIRISGGTLNSGSSSGSSGGSYSGGSVDYAPTIQEPVINTHTFSDIPSSHWAYSAVNAVYKLGIIAGDGNGKFNPDDKLTREQFAKLVSLTFGITSSNDDVNFSDVNESDWSYPYITALSSRSIIQGYNGIFDKNANITRQDMAVILYRAMKESGLNVNKETKTVFLDADSISDYAIESVNILSSKRIINGYDGKFRPTDFCTRAEAAKLIYEVCRLRGVCK